MSRACTICTHPQRDAIDAAIRAREPHQAIAMQYGVTRDSVRRHAASHVDARPQTKRTESPKRTSSADRTPRERVQGEHISVGEVAATQTAFLAAFVELANESAACRVAHIDRGTVRYWEEHDEAFSPRYHEARAAINDAIRGEIYRRGALGYEREVATAKGSVVTVREYSDRLLEFFAKACMPEFRDKSQMDVTSNGQTVGQGVTLDQLAALMAQNQQSMTQWEREHGYEHDDLDAH